MAEIECTNEASARWAVSCATRGRNQVISRSCLRDVAQRLRHCGSCLADQPRGSTQALASFNKREEFEELTLYLNLLMQNLKELKSERGLERDFFATASVLHLQCQRYPNGHEPSNTRS
jgi:hypothetical protein